MKKSILTQILYGSLAVIGYGCLPPTYTSEQFLTMQKDTNVTDSVENEVAGQDQRGLDVSQVDIVNADIIFSEINYDATDKKSNEGLEVDESSDVFKGPMPYGKDEQCIALFHFEVLAPFEDACNGLKLNEYNTNEVGSASGFGKARLFDGKAYLELPDSTLLKVKSGLTLEALVKPQLSSQSYDGKSGSIITKEDFYEGYFLKIEEGKVTGGAMLSDGKIHMVSSAYVLPIDTFTHLAFTYDGAKMRLYVERKLVAEELAQGTIVYKTNKSVFMGLNAYENGFKGAIDEVRVSDVAREF